MEDGFSGLLSYVSRAANKRLRAQLRLHCQATTAYDRMSMAYRQVPFRVTCPFRFLEAIRVPVGW